MARTVQAPLDETSLCRIRPSQSVQVTLQVNQNQDRQWDRRIAVAQRESAEARKFPGASGSKAIFDVKFCPYLPAGASPIFAFTCGQNVFIAKLSHDDDQPCSIVHAIEDADEGRNMKSMDIDGYQCHNSLAWMRDVRTGNPLLLFSGSVPKIHVYDVINQRCMRSLTGHGGGIQEIVPHPTQPSVFATCSDDNEVRIWNLASKFENSWCAVICHGEIGHTSTVYSIAFTSNGRYLMSGGRDTWLHLWALPDPEELLQLPKEKVRSKRIYYPHFSTSAVHSDIIDCIRFYGDLIVSRSVGRKIMIWAIHGFSSKDLPPAPPTKREPGQSTSSAFGNGLMVLYSFDHHHGKGDPMITYYHRFTIYPDHRGRPILAMGHIGQPIIYFWDLSMLEKDKETAKFSGDPLEEIKAHDSYTPSLDKQKKNIGLFRAVDCSPDGEWLVAGYDDATLIISWR